MVTPEALRERIRQRQPTENSCGQTCIAMLLDIPVADVLRDLPDRPRGTRASELRAYLHLRGFDVSDRLQRTGWSYALTLPPIAILRLKWPGVALGHWILWIHGGHIDPAQPAARGGRVTSFLAVARRV